MYLRMPLFQFGSCLAFAIYHPTAPTMSEGSSSNNNLKKWVGDGSKGGTLQVVPQEAETLSDINSITINFASATS
jgi:hypothetical protein